MPVDGNRGASRVPRNVYTLVHMPSAADDEAIDVHVRPTITAGGGQASSLLGRMKLAPHILVEDAFAFTQGAFDLNNTDLAWVAGMSRANAQGGYPILSKGVVAVVDKKIVSDAAGDFALIRIKPNRGGSIDLAAFCRSFGQSAFPIAVTLHLDLGGLAGGAAGIGIPAGAVLLPVKGETKIRVRAAEWKITVAKEMWKDAGEIDLTKVPGVDLAGLRELALRGGTLRIALDGGIRVDATIVRWNEEHFRDARVRWMDPHSPLPDGLYDEDSDTYRFDIPAPPDAPPGPKAEVDVRVEVWPVDEIQNVFPEMVRRVRENCELLDTDLMPDAERFIQACVDRLAGTPQAQLVETGPQFVNGINAASYFEGFTSISAKAFKVSLELHKDAYTRYMENLVAGFMELLFFGLDKAEFFEKVFGRFIKNGREAAEHQLQAEAKTLAHTVAEETEKALIPKQQAVDAARDRLRQQCRDMSAAAAKATADSRSLVGTVLKEQAKIAEEQAAKTVLESEVEALAQTVKGFDESTQALAADVARAAQIRQSLATAAKSAEPSHAVDAWTTTLRDLDGRIIEQQNALAIRRVEETTAALARKSDALRKSSETIAKLEESVRAGMRSVDELDALARRHLQEVNNSLLKKLSDAEAESLALWHQAKLLREVKAGRGTQEQFKTLIDQSMQNLPDVEALRRGVIGEISGTEMCEALRQYEAVLEREIRELDLPSPGTWSQVPDGLAVQAALSRQASERLRMTRDILEQIEKAELTSDAILKQYIGWGADYIKDKFNERAGTLREALVKVVQVEYKAVHPKYYDPTFAEFVWSLVDTSLQSTAELWNYLCKTVGDWFRAANTSPVPEHRLAAYFLKELGDASFNALTVLLVMADMILQAIMKMLQGIRSVTNGVMFELSRLTEQRCWQARAPVVPMPARLPDEFFEFSREAVGKVADLLDPTRDVERSGGRAAIVKDLQRDCTGTYDLDYEPQGQRARHFMAALAGANGALDPQWLTSNQVRSTNRDATRLLQEILAPLKQYQITMQRPPDRDLGTIWADVYVGEWTPADFDKMFEVLGNAISIGLKVSAAGLLVGGLFLSCVPFAAPAGVAAIGVGGGMMVAGGPSDQLWAALRVGMVSFFTMPLVLGSQFDVMRVYSLAYQSVFHGVDISDATKDPGAELLRNLAASLPSDG
ncbi:MAG: hypothetical protein AB7J63_00990 [Vicinamibacterales bacterium]